MTKTDHKYKLVNKWDNSQKNDNRKYKIIAIIIFAIIVVLYFMLHYSFTLHHTNKILNHKQKFKSPNKNDNIKHTKNTSNKN